MKRSTIYLRMSFFINTCNSKTAVGRRSSSRNRLLAQSQGVALLCTPRSSLLLSELQLVQRWVGPLRLVRDSVVPVRALVLVAVHLLPNRLRTWER